MHINFLGQTDSTTSERHASMSMPTPDGRNHIKCSRLYPVPFGKKFGIDGRALELELHHECCDTNAKCSPETPSECTQCNCDDT